MKKAWQKLLNELHQFSECRQSITDLTAGKYGVGLFGLSRTCLPRERRNQRRRVASFGLVRGAVKLGIGWFEVSQTERRITTS